MLKNEPINIKKSDGKLYGIYRAVVVNNDDSDEWNEFEGGTGRVRVRIWGINTSKKNKDDKEGIPDDELLWAEPAYPVIEGSLTDFGVWSVPINGTHVFIFFENGDPMQPRYFACAPGIQPSNIYDNGDDGFVNSGWIRSDRLGEPDYSRAARGITSGTFIERMNNNLLSADASFCSTALVQEESVDIGDYPHILSIETHGDNLGLGNVLAFDSTPGNNKRIYLFNPGSNNEGSWIYINQDGDVTIHSENDVISISQRHRKIGVKGDSVRAVEGYENIGVQRDWTVDVEGTAYIYASSIYIGNCGGQFKRLATEDHVHGDVEKGSSYTGPPTDITQALKAN